jgi:hypothetical protein
MSLLNNKKSLFDKLTKFNSQISYKGVNVNTLLYGTHINLIKITKFSDDEFIPRSGVDVFGHSEKRYKFEVISNCILKYPFTDVEIFNYINSDNLIQTKSIDVNPVLPIKLTLPIGDDYKNEPVSVVAGDLFVDVKYDERRNMIPIILEVMRSLGKFDGKYLLDRNLELSLLRGNMDKELKNYIFSYIQKMEAF